MAESAPSRPDAANEKASPFGIRSTSPNGHVNQTYATETRSLAVAIARFEAMLPGWWWRIGSCSISRDASCGPDVNGCDAHLLLLDDQAALRIFDEGFHVDLDHPDATLADALDVVMEQALGAKRRHGAGTYTYRHDRDDAG